MKVFSFVFLIPSPFSLALRTSLFLSAPYSSDREGALSVFSALAKLNFLLGLGFRLTLPSVTVFDKALRDP